VAEMARRFNVAPKVAVLAFPNLGASGDRLIERVRKAVQIVQERKPGLTVDSESPADTAAVPEIYSGLGTPGAAIFARDPASRLSIAWAPCRLGHCHVFSQ
jgi:hypothetical protein